MKYQNLLLSFSLAAAFTLGATLSAQAKLTPEQQKKAAAEAKAKADREAKQKLMNEFRGVRNTVHKMAGDKEFAKVAPYCEKMLEYMDKIAKYGPLSQGELREFETIAHIYRWEWKNFKPETKRFYEEIIKRADGDVAVGWIEMYAMFLKEQKMMTPEEIAKILDGRYKVKNVSEDRMIRLMISDNKLDEADARIAKLAAAEKDPAKKIIVYRRFIKDFNAKRVFGAQYANKYYKELMKLTTAPDDKCRLMGEYAGFAEHFAFLSMEEVDKIRAERHKMTGLSHEMQINLLCEKITAIALPEEAEGLVENAMAAAGNDFKMRHKVLWNVKGAFLSRESRVRLRDSKWFFSFMEKQLIEYPFWRYHTYNDMLMSFLNDIAQSDRLGDVEKMYQRIVAHDIKLKNTAVADYEKVLAAKKALEKKREDLELGRKELEKQLREEKDKAKRDAMEKRIKTMREEFNKTNGPLGETNRAFSAARDNMNIKYERLATSQNALSECYLRLGRRYMESTDPVFLRKAIAVQKQRIAHAENATTKLNSCTLIMNYAITMQDYTQARQIFAEAKEIAEKDIAAAEARNDKHQANRIRGSIDVMKFPLAFISYYEEDYAKAVEALLPLLQTPHRDYNARMYEFLVRSYVALGEYENALKYTDKMVEHAPGYMKNRYKQMINELKERMAEAK